MDRSQLDRADFRPDQLALLYDRTRLHLGVSLMTAKEMPTFSNIWSEEPRVAEEQWDKFEEKFDMRRISYKCRPFWEICVEKDSASPDILLNRSVARPYTDVCESTQCQLAWWQMKSPHIRNSEQA